MSPIARSIAALVLLVAGGDCALAQRAIAPSTPHPAVCRIVVTERDGLAFGSGTLIDARDGYGLVVTNWHVVSDAAGPIRVSFPNGFTSEARPLKLDETWDLAALVVWRPPAEPVALAERPPRPGEPLVICGYGQGTYRAAEGRCTDYYAPEVGMPQELVELDVEARQGDSGGPIFNDHGRLAGVLFGAGRGTTLGSFGGRVHRFLATLAPDIGRPQAVAPPRGQIAAAPVKPAPLPKLQEPAPASVPARDSADAKLAAAEPPKSEWPATLADKRSAPKQVVDRRAAADWQSAPAPSPLPRPVWPEADSPEVAENPRFELTWWDDARSVLALVGVAALVIHGVRALG